MAKKKELSRRDFLKVAGTAAAGSALLPGVVKGAPSKLEIPNFLQGSTITIGVGSWAERSMRLVIDQLGFTEQTGIEVEVLVRPGDAPSMLTQMAGAIAANTSPFDVLDFEDEIASSFSRAGWLMGLDDLLESDFWDDWPQAMLDMRDTWNQFNGETFRIHHNFEPQYWWYRQDWFDEMGIAVPTTWDEVAAMGAIFTNEETGVWATEEGMLPGAFMNVYLAWITRQAGGDPFEVGDEFRTALQYIFDLMHTHNTLNPAGMQAQYNQQNQKYLDDRVAFMRQWPFFFDVTRNATDWYEPGKAEVALPPVGPGGPSASTYAAGWGWGIPNTAENPGAAQELVRWLVDRENAAAAAELGQEIGDVWYLSARDSVLDAVSDEGVIPFMKMYTEANIIGVRPFHPKFLEALSVLEDAAASYFTRQISLDEAMEQAEEGIEALA